MSKSQAGLLLSSACGSTEQHALLPPYPIYRRLRPHPHTKCALTISILFPHMLVHDAMDSVSCMLCCDGGKGKYIFRSGACNTCDSGCGQVRTYERRCTMLRRVATCRNVLQPVVMCFNRDQVYMDESGYIDLSRHVSGMSAKKLSDRFVAELTRACRRNADNVFTLPQVPPQHVATQ